MTINTGTRLGPYEILSQLGAGGMGEVWRGRDTRLGRDVAIKILPPGFAENAQFRARFEREAKTISSLNHPNICTLFDVGQEGDTHFLVMELIEGESLADRIQKGPLPLDQVLRIGAQVADALDRAHMQGIVHRDLKPGNVMISKSGAKLLDFGLARSSAESAPLKGMTEMPTQAKPLTQEGTILGTFQYMAPEQLEGLEADARTDIFALGALLYEMATGKRAFEGTTRTSLIAAIVSSQPAPISQVAAMAPPALDHVVRKCLEKDPDDRWQSARDVSSELRWISEAGSQAGVASAVTLRRRTRERLAWTTAAFLALVAIAFIVLFFTRPSTPHEGRPFHASLVLPDSLRPHVVAAGPIAISPDGTRLASLVAKEGETFIALYDFATGVTSINDATRGASFPFWSPDSRSLGFFAGEKLRRVDASGGPAQPLADAKEGRGGAWSPEGVIVFAPDIRNALLMVSQNGGTPVAVTTKEDEAASHRNPCFLPDGKTFLFGSRSRVMSGSIDGGESRLVLDKGSNVQYSDGRLLFVRDGNLLAQRFDPDTLSLHGTISALADNINYNNPRDLGDFTVSDDGTLAFRHASSSESRLAWFDRNGELLEYLMPRGEYSVRAVSRDRRKAVLSRTDPADGTADLWVFDLASKQLQRATSIKSPSRIGAAFSPDGERLAVSTLSSGPAGNLDGSLWLQPVSGARTDQVVLEETGFTVYDWTPDGKVLLGTSQRASTRFDLTYVRLEEDPPTVHDFVATEALERLPVFSPDGKWVAYLSSESGENEVFLVDFPNATQKLQVSRDGGRIPSFSSDGRELHYVSPDGSVMSVPVKLGAMAELGEATKLGFSNAQDDSRILNAGDRFLVNQDVSGDRIEPIRIVRNWTAGLPE